MRSGSHFKMQEIHGDFPMPESIETKAKKVPVLLSSLMNNFTAHVADTQRNSFSEIVFFKKTERLYPDRPRVDRVRVAGLFAA